MKSLTIPRPESQKRWIRAALILLAAGALFSLSGCHCWPTHYGHGWHGGGYGGYGYGGGGGYGGYCPSY